MKNHKTAVGYVLPQPDADSIRYIFVNESPDVVREKLAHYATAHDVYELVAKGSLDSIGDSLDKNVSASNFPGGIVAPTRTLRERLENDMRYYGAQGAYIVEDLFKKIVWIQAYESKLK